jgi:phage terminase large subunit GpA-like protein
MSYESELEDIIEGSRHEFSNIKPSDWYEQNRIMPPGSPYPGPWRYDRTPYMREIVDCLSPDNPAKVIAFMKGAQQGASSGVIIPGIGYIISQNPGNILFLTGHSDLSDEAMLKVDEMIDSCGLRPLIRPSILRAKNQRTGDTNKSKEFPNGSLASGSISNHNMLRQRDIRYGFIDDTDGGEKSKAATGSTVGLIKARFTAFRHHMKLLFISTPQLKQDSIIEPLYLQGDQRRYNIHCPCCHEPITFEWSIHVNDKDSAGIFYKLDNHGKLIPESVGYICQECGGFFDDRNKEELNLNGLWIPTAIPQVEDHVSFHMSALYAPSAMYNWRHYVNDYLSYNPQGQAQDVSGMKSFTNLVLGLTWEDKGDELSATALMRNIRKYEVGIIPEKLSISDGNGKIILLTCACDLNGTEEDSRLDYEVVAWSESGASYSILHGSIGTFIPREGAKKNKQDREHWTYNHHKPKSVWGEFEKVLKSAYNTDTGRKMTIAIGAVDTGHYTNQAYEFIDNTNYYAVGVKGDKEHKFIKYGIDVPTFKHAKERSKLYILQVNKLKDEISQLMKLNWDEGNDESQPSGFMNFPQPANGFYDFQKFFEHYQAEHRVVSTDKQGTISSKWVKKDSTVQNHFFDVRIYNMALRDIMMYTILKELKVKPPYSWSDFASVLSGKL